ncbi:DUF3048 domain-containing protein [Aquibacillus albus]|uniref:DUF3048 domain-containing protein n=1 Tax=Aquibacillus albus TaxID=1168171 RepID=A0ABS2N423_9BACI|nr:DUF3048 domain-containing protein [Aquibacillus albus]MBM7572798.1 hypothetical protein [Aquibacillus albus]
MRKEWRFIQVVFGLLVLLLVIAACGNNDQVSETDDEQSTDDAVMKETESNVEQESEPAPDPEPVEETFENVSPLTGVGTNDPIDDRIVAVMVNNHPSARPQTGLTEADIVFEILAEGNITRLMALFQSEKPEVVGPVRSARPYYFHLADDYGALYVYHGAAFFIEEMLKAGAADNINGAYYDNDGHLFKRADFRVAPHNSYLQFGAVYQVAEGIGYEVKTDQHISLEFLSETESESISGEQAEEISISYTNTPVRYLYDSEKQLYTRYNGDSQTVDLETEEEVRLDNLFIVEAHHQVIDDAGRREIDLQSGGDAYLIQKGKVKKVQWKNVDGVILPFNGEEQLKFVPGKTWVNVIPTSSGLETAVSIE